MIAACSGLSAPPVAQGGDRSHPALDALLAEHWDWSLAGAPVWGSEIGDRRYDDVVEDISPQARARRRAERKVFLARARAMLEQPLLDRERETLAILIEDLESSEAVEECRFDEWLIWTRDNPITRWNALPELQPSKTPFEGERLLARYRKIPRWIDQHIANLRRGHRDRWVAVAGSVRRVLAMVRDQLALPVEQWPLATPITQSRKGWAQHEATTFRAEVLRVIDTEIRPALARYASLLESEILPSARVGDAVGLWALPSGEGCYAAQIRSYTGLALSPASLAALGERELGAAEHRVAALGRDVLSTADAAASFVALRDDPRHQFRDEAEVEAGARAAVADATAKAAEVLADPPRAPLEIVRVPGYEAPYAPTAAYIPSSQDGRAGQYRVNVSQPRTRARWASRVLAFHEGIPGHHFQLALMQQARLPRFRREVGLYAFVEGWALYAEGLADELGLYPQPIDRLGAAAYDAWRAARIVVDTGIHARRWTDEDAVAYLQKHTALSALEISNEVDRHVTWAGQALSYKIGELAIRALRGCAENALGEQFDRRDFHRIVLAEGAVTLPILERRVERWASTHAGRAIDCDLLQALGVVQ